VLALKAGLSGAVGKMGDGKDDKLTAGSCRQATSSFSPAGRTCQGS
jgi:hypothetical protein